MCSWVKCSEVEWSEVGVKWSEVGVKWSEVG
jgi:hypothetical protein